VLPKDQVSQKDNLKAMIVSATAAHRDPQAGGAKGIERLICSWSAIASDHLGRAERAQDDTYLLPICTQFETSGSRTRRTARCRGQQIVKPIFESKDDYEHVPVGEETRVRRPDV